MHKGFSLVFFAFLGLSHKSLALIGRYLPLRSTAQPSSATNGQTFLEMSSTPNVPTKEQVSEDSFMQQVSHAAKLVDILGQNEKDPELEELLKAQLSHSDGIRGFFVQYLTGDNTPADKPEVPRVLQEALQQSETKELIPLACMNVIMPTGMITMHKDPELSEQSRKTSERGSRILALLRDNQQVKDNCKAILAVARNETNATEIDTALVKYWMGFFEKWGYKDEQKKDIAEAIVRIL